MASMLYQLSIIKVKTSKNDLTIFIIVVVCWAVLVQLLYCVTATNDSEVAILCAILNLKKFTSC